MDDEDLSFTHILTATGDDGGATLYGLTTTGKVFEYDPVRRGWRPLSMKALAETEVTPSDVPRKPRSRLAGTDSDPDQI
jgi:hypothetical protein